MNDQTVNIKDYTDLSFKYKEIEKDKILVNIIVNQGIDKAGH